MWRWRRRREQPVRSSEITVLLARVNAALDQNAVVYDRIEELIRRDGRDA